MKTLEEIFAHIKEERERALNAVKENKGEDPNSYGAGYDLGHADAFGELIEWLEDPNAA